MKISQALAIICFLLIPTSVLAKYDPRTRPNNQYGIHVVDPTDLNGVESLLNSNGGTWGYIKFVIPETDRNTDKWNSVFRELRRRKLIPIIRIATRIGDNGWDKPTEESLKDWPAFLNSLSWPVENRYVVLFNEPNHAGEWGGEIDPQDFAQKSLNMVTKLRDASEDYFILPAGLDVSAQTDGRSMSADEFYKDIKKTVPEYFEAFDGWNSHSYPNPAFSSLPTKTGRGSLRSFQWEIDFLKSLGVSKNYPIMIGETGWSHNEGLVRNQALLSTQTVASYTKIAAETVWNDKRIFAVVPFLYNYQSQPFDVFSWKKINGEGFYEHYFTYQALPKAEGQPKQREQYEVFSTTFPEKLVAGSLYQFPIEIKNSGQAIISARGGYVLSLADPSGQFTFTSEILPTLEPDQIGHILMSIRTPEKIGTYQLRLELQHGTDIFPLAQGIIYVIPPPALKVEVQLGWRNTSEATQAAVLVYDGNKVLQEFTNLSVDNGIISTPGILSIIPGQYYRIVTLVPYYLPRQSIQPIGDQVTVITNNRFLPFDGNNDQRLSFNDFTYLLRQKPSDVLPRFFGP